MAGSQNGRLFRAVRSDRGIKYLLNLLEERLCSRGTDRQLTTTNSSRENGVAEHLSRTLLDFVRTMLLSKNLAKMLVEKSFSTGTFTGNRFISRALPIKKYLPACGRHLLLLSPTCAFWGLKAEISPLEAV